MAAQQERTTCMFEHIQPAPPDPILGLSAAFNADPRPNKINLGVGVYKDANGKTPILSSVKQAERLMLDAEQSKSYLPIDGAAAYAKCVQSMLFGQDHEIITNDRATTSHTPGGTGALRVAADYLHQNHPHATVWLSDPTWANHPQIFAAAGVATKTYPYFDKQTNALNFDAMLKTLDAAPAGDVVLLHGCCHNPTGVDPSIEQWAMIADALSKQGLIPLIDFAYQGFAGGLEKDAAGLRAVCDRARDLLICSSYSKNFGLYNERVGALTLVANTHAQAQAVQSRIKQAIRANYSNPSAHGGSIVVTTLNNPELRKQWEGELTQMRNRINGMRQRFQDALNTNGAVLPGGDNAFITKQKGMFSFSGLNPQQVETLREDHAVYIVGSGRINVAGLTEANMQRFCQAVQAVL